EPLATGVGDAVHLLAPGAPRAPARATFRGRRPALSAEGCQLTGERAGRGCAGRGRAGRVVGHGLHVAVALETTEGRVERPERDRQARAEQLAEPLAQLVAVQVVLVEEPEDGEVDHAESSGPVRRRRGSGLGARPMSDRYIESIYRRA